MGEDSPRVKIAILTLTEREDIHQFVQKLNEPVEYDVFEKLLIFEELLNFTAPKDWSAVILLHSVKLGRLSLTNVPDARYDTLLSGLYNKSGKRISSSSVFLVLLPLCQ